MVSIPDGVNVKVDGLAVEVSGPAGKQKRSFAMRGVGIKHEGKELTVSGPAREANTLSAHLANMLKGSKEGFKIKLKAIYAHFPISVEVKGKDILIKNFVGEKQPRKAKVCGDTKVDAKGAEVNVSGPSIEDVGQTVANIRSATKIRKRDSRVFQDGIYPFEG